MGHHDKFITERRIDVIAILWGNHNNSVLLYFQTSQLTTDSFKKMDKLKLLQLKFVRLSGSYEDFSEHLRWLCWIGFNLKTIPSNLFMGNLVALDMSYSWLEVFELPMVGIQYLCYFSLPDFKSLFVDMHLKINLSIFLFYFFCNRFFNHCRF